MNEFELDVKEKEMFVESEERHNQLLGGANITPIVDIGVDFFEEMGFDFGGIDLGVSFETDSKRDSATTSISVDSNCGQDEVVVGQGDEKQEHFLLYDHYDSMLPVNGGGDDENVIGGGGDAYDKQSKDDNSVKKRPPTPGLAMKKRNVKVVTRKLHSSFLVWCFVCNYKSNNNNNNNNKYITLIIDYDYETSEYETETETEGETETEVESETDDGVEREPCE